MISQLPSSQFASILSVVNDAAQAYRGVIPADCWKEPYMATEELKTELEDGVKFYGWFEKDALVGVMGTQSVQDVTLIRHAYVLTSHQRRGIGEKLLDYLLDLAKTQIVLVGTWQAAWWAIRFYEKHGFYLVEDSQNRLGKYWSISDRQSETSVVLELKRKNRP